MLPSPLTILAGVIVLFFVVLVVVRGPVDADYWWHITTGRMIVENGAVPVTDPFSFAYDGPWVAHEWLGEVIIHLLVAGAGYPLAAAIFGLATASSILLPAYALDRGGVSLRAMVPWLAVGTYTLASYATVRPQVLSWLLLSVLIAILMGQHAEHRYRLWAAVPLMALWANVHGLYVVGLGVVGVYVIFTLMGRTALARRRLTALGVLVGCTIAACVTPAGPAGLLYPLRYLRQDDWGTAFIAEWQPADFADPRQWGIAVIAIGSVLLLARRRAPGWLLTIGFVGLGSALIAVRNAPLAVIMTMPMLAYALEAWLPASHGTVGRRARQRRLLEMSVALVVVVAIVAILPRVARSDAEATFPITAFDRLEELDSDARLFVDYDWGGYAIHRLHVHGGSVFIDGRSDMYPRAIFSDYLAIRSGDPAWTSLVSEYRVEAILLPTSAPLVAVALAAGWCAELSDERATLLVPCAGLSRVGA